MLRTHTQRGRMTRPQRGIYRLVHFPAGEHEELVTAWLWSEQAGVISHQTALSLHDRSDVLPAQVHLTLPATWSKRRLRVPPGVVLHHAEVPPEDRGWFSSVPTTNPRRTLNDCARGALGRPAEAGCAASAPPWTGQEGRARRRRSRARALRRNRDMTVRTYSTPDAFKQALEQRLRTTTPSAAAMVRKRQFVVFDRFLARVVTAFGDAVTLKGGLVSSFASSAPELRKTWTCEWARAGSVWSGNPLAATLRVMSAEHERERPRLSDAASRAFWSGAAFAERFFMGLDEVHQALRRLTLALEGDGIPYAIAGAMALNAHGYRRVTTDVDVLLTREGLAQFKAKHLGLGWVERFPGSKGMRDTEGGVQIDILIAGEYPGDGLPKPVAFPSPDVAVRGDGFRVLSIKDLIELKLASGLSNPDRLKDLADVQELVRHAQVPLELGEQLDETVRPKFVEIWNATRRSLVDEG